MASGELEIIRRLIREETIFLRHYAGKVLNNRDEIKRGRVQVALYELNWVTPATAPWCNPRYIQGIRIPKAGDWVEVYFINGESARPVWLGVSAEVRDNILASYAGEKTDVLYENRESGIGITFDADLKEFIIGVIAKAMGPAGITLKSGDASSWCPNVLSTCPYSGAPHGGTTAGITKLKGG